MAWMCALCHQLVSKKETHWCPVTDYHHELFIEVDLEGTEEHGESNKRPTD